MLDPAWYVTYILNTITYTYFPDDQDPENQPSSGWKPDPHLWLISYNGSGTDKLYGEGYETYIQGDQLNMTVFFWYLVIGDLSGVRFCTRIHWTSHFLQGTRKTGPSLTSHPVYGVRNGSNSTHRAVMRGFIFSMKDTLKQWCIKFLIPPPGGGGKFIYTFGEEFQVEKRGREFEGF